MSERMNKERAKEEIIATRKTFADKKQKLEEKNEFEKSELLRRENKSFIHLYDKKIQALDIAIESLQQDQETKEKMWAKQLNECEECEVINNEWVDVRDKLPQFKEEVLVCSDNGTISIKARKKNTPLCKISENDWVWSKRGSYYTPESIIAWKPLPQPYERKE